MSEEVKQKVWTFLVTYKLRSDGVPVQLCPKCVAALAITGDEWELLSSVEKFSRLRKNLAAELTKQARVDIKPEHLNVYNVVNLDKVFA